MHKVQMKVKIGLSVYPDSISKIEYAKYRPIMKNKVVVNPDDSASKQRNVCS